MHDNRECERCHEEEATEWRSSLHHDADTNGPYRRSFAIEPMPFCRSCHAPESDPTHEETADVADLGVGCVTCHVTTDAGVLAAPGDGRGPAPHGLLRDGRFAEAEACAACHEFAFPGRGGAGEADLMQSTVSEHRSSSAATVTCAACHMPREASGRRNHAFVASRDPGFVRRAIAIHVDRVGPTSLVITLTPKELGHAFPTGDLFRRLSLSAEAAGADQMVVARAQRFLTRHFSTGGPTGKKRLERDDRVRDPEPMAVVLDVGARGAGHDIAWRVSYERVAHPNGVDDDEASVEGEIVLAEGTMPAGTLAPEPFSFKVDNNTWHGRPDPFE